MSERVGSLYIDGRSWRSVIVCRFLSLRLWTNIEYSYCVAIKLICLNVFLIFVIGSSSIFLGFSLMGCVLCPLRLQPIP
jgi:hypothetical protein